MSKLFKANKSKTETTTTKVQERANLAAKGAERVATLTLDQLADRSGSIKAVKGQAIDLARFVDSPEVLVVVNREDAFVSGERSCADWRDRPSEVARGRIIGYVVDCPTYKDVDLTVCDDLSIYPIAKPKTAEKASGLLGEAIRTAVAGQEKHSLEREFRSLLIRRIANSAISDKVATWLDSSTHATRIGFLSAIGVKDGMKVLSGLEEKKARKECFKAWKQQLAADRDGMKSRWAEAGRAIQVMVSRSPELQAIMNAFLGVPETAAKPTRKPRAA